MTFWKHDRVNDADVRRRALAAIARNPDHKRRVLRHLRARQHIDACKLKAEEYFAGQMGMTLAQWQRAQWGVRGLR